MHCAMHVCHKCDSCLRLSSLCSILQPFSYHCFRIIDELKSAVDIRETRIKVTTCVHFY